MIGKLTGMVDSICDAYIIVDVSGVGYIVFCTSKTIQRIGEGEAISLIIETHVREDHIHLYGFFDEAEKDMFKLLTSVQGVGVKMGMAILSAFDASDLSGIIASEDKKMLTRANGVGAKLAGRIVSELQDKISIPFTPSTPHNSKVENTNIEGTHGKIHDAVSALVNLGFSRKEAYYTVKNANESNPGITLEEIISDSLKNLTG